VGRLARPFHWFTRIVLAGAVSVTCANCAGRRQMHEPLGAQEIHIERGNTRAALLMHGYLTGPPDLGPLPQALAQAGWDVHVPFHYGHGTCPADLRDATAEKTVATMRARYAQLRARYERVALVGFSMGGAVAALLAGEHPPERLVLVAPFFGVTYKWYYILPPRIWHKIMPCVAYVRRPEGLVKVNRREAVKEIKSYHVVPRAANQTIFSLAKMVRRPGVAEKITVPLLMAYSPDDDVCNPKAQRAFFERVASREKVKVACRRSNHQILNDYDRFWLAERIVAFLAGGDRPAEGAVEGRAAGGNGEHPH
jgi:carboxylesterase